MSFCNSSATVPYNNDNNNDIIGLFYVLFLQTGEEPTHKAIFCSQMLTQTQACTRTVNRMAWRGEISKMICKSLNSECVGFTDRQAANSRQVERSNWKSTHQKIWNYILEFSEASHLRMGACLMWFVYIIIYKHDLVQILNNQSKSEPGWTRANKDIQAPVSTLWSCFDFK